MAALFGNGVRQFIAVRHADELQHHVEAGDPFYTSRTDTDGNTVYRLDGTFSYGQNGSVTVITTEPFEVDPDTGQLSQGEIVIEGANGSKLVLSATPDGDLRIQLDANGDGDFTDDGDLDAEFGYGCFLSNTCATA